MPATASTWKLGLAAIGGAAFLSAAAWYATKDSDPVAVIPESDPQIPTSGQVLESDRPDLLEEPAFKRPADEAEPG